MLNNSSQWLTLRSADDRSSTLRPEARSVDANTARSSLDHHSSTKPRTSGLERLKQGAIPTRSLTALSTPHDRVLEKMYYHPRKSEGALPLPSELDANHPPLNRDHSQTGAIHHVEANTNENTGSRTLNEPANSREGAVSATPTTSFASNILPATRLYDPFDGAPLGIIVPAETTTRGDSMPVYVEGNSNEELWAHLSRVLDLQHQIARMHVDMEGAGPGKQTDGKGKGSLGNPPRPAFTRPRTTSTGSMHGAEIEDEEGVGVVDEESEKLKAREREFKKLATQFEGRKETINEMMSKLDDLSKALTEFHSLQAPKIEFSSSSRNNSLGQSSNDQPQMPTIIPPSTSTSPVSPGDSSIQSPAVPMHIPTPYLQPSQPRGELFSNPGASTQLLTTSLGRKGPVPALIINSIQPGSQTHMVDSPVSMASLKLPHEEEDPH